MITVEATMTINQLMKLAKFITTTSGFGTSYYHKLGDDKWLYVFPCCGVYEIWSDYQLIKQLEVHSLNSTIRDGYSLKWE